MKRILSLAFIALTVVSAQAQIDHFNMQGPAIGNLSTFAMTTPCGTMPSATHELYQLTDGSSCSGLLNPSAMWSNGHASNLPIQLDFTSSFQLDFWISFSNPGGIGYTPADGICAVFGSNLYIPRFTGSINAGGGYMGYYNNTSTNPDFNNSLAVEFDIFNNGTGTLNDPSPYFDHVMLAENGDATLVPVGGAAVQMDPSSPTVSDGLWRHMVISWDCTTNTITVSNLTCSPTLLLSAYINPTLFTNPSEVYWGFTAGTGAYCSTQQIADPNVIYTRSCGFGHGGPCGSVSVTGSYAGIAPDGNCIFNYAATAIPAPGYIIYEFKWLNSCPYSTLTTPSSTWSSEVCAGPGSTLLLDVVFVNPATGDTCDVLIDYTVTCNGGLSRRPGDEPNTGNSIKKADKVTIAPNPANTLINISGVSVNDRYSIIDLAGRVMLSGTIQNTTQPVDISLLSDGMYLINIYTNEGMKINTSKFTKE